MRQVQNILTLAQTVIFPIVQKCLIIYLQIYNDLWKFLQLLMNWCYDSIFQGVQENRIGNAIIIVSKNKISKNIKVLLNKFGGYVRALCGFNCLKIINFFHNFMTFNLKETKRQTRVKGFLYCNYARVEPKFHDCFHQWITYIVTHWFRFIILGNTQRCYDIRQKLQNRCSILSFYITLPCSTRVILSLKSTFFDNKDLTKPKRFLIITQAYLIQTSTKLSFTFSQKCNT